MFAKRLPGVYRRTNCSQLKLRISLESSDAVKDNGKQTAFTVSVSQHHPRKYNL
jgi:hypothetical protein